MDNYYNLFASIILLAVKDATYEGKNQEIKKIKEEAMEWLQNSKLLKMYNINIDSLIESYKKTNEYKVRAEHCARNERKRKNKNGRI